MTVVELTIRKCTRCGNRFVWPQHTRPPKGECPRCNPSLPGMETT